MSMLNTLTAQITLAADTADATTGHDVATGVTILFAGILVALIACLALEEKIHAKKSIIVSVFAVICLILGEVFGLIETRPMNFLGHEITLPVYIPGIDWGVIAIILGSGLFVDVTSRSGLFTWIAIKLTKLSKGDPVILLWVYGAMTVVFSAVLNNVTAMVIVGSLTAVSLAKLGRNDKLLGFLLVEGLLTNVGGLLTLISSVPNIIVGQQAGIAFVTFFINAAPYVIVATVATLFLGAKLFGIERLKTDEEKAKGIALVEGFDENDGIESRGFFWFGAVMLVAFIAVIAITSSNASEVLGDLGMGFVAMTFGLIMLLRFKSKADEFYREVDWDLLAFFAGLFVTINVMEHAQVLNMIGSALKPVLSLGENAGGALLLALAAVFSSVTDNIPLAAMLAKILANDPQVVPPTMETNPTSPFWWSVIFGANLGGNLTPIGSASTLVAVTIMHKHNLKISFARFVITALPFALVHIALAIAYVLLLTNLQ